MTNERPSVSENPKSNSTPIPNQCLEVDGSTAFERTRGRQCQIGMWHIRTWWKSPNATAISERTTASEPYSICTR